MDAPSHRGAVLVRDAEDAAALRLPFLGERELAQLPSLPNQPHVQKEI